MFSIRVKNLRSLKDTKYIEIKPLTILVGENSSGKSTFLRTFPLLRQSFEARTAGPLLWYGRFVDFGTFRDAIYSEASKQKIIFGFKFNLSFTNIFSGRYYPGFRRRLYKGRIQIKDIPVTIELSISKGSKQDDIYVDEIRFSFFGHNIYIEIEDGKNVAQLLVNNRDLTDLEQDLTVINRSGLIPEIEEKRPSQRKRDELRHYQFPSFIDGLIDEVGRHVHRNTQFQSILDMIEDFEIGTSDKMLELLKDPKDKTKTWVKNTKDWTKNSDDFTKLRDLIIAFNVLGLLGATKSYLNLVMRESNYIAPVRATAERYYRLQNLAVDEVDYKGQNLAMFLRSLTERERRTFSNWLLETMGFSITTKLAGGHISINLIEEGAKEPINLADKGFGFSQILPIVTQLWVLSTRRSRNKIRRIESRRFGEIIPITFVIEQPELHLHPRMQAKLVDAFIKAIEEAKKIDVDLRLIIETHSEVMINRIGHRIAKGDIKNNDVNLILFERLQSNTPTNVKIGKFNSEGFLENWPFGFFHPDNI